MKPNRWWFARWLLITLATVSALILIVSAGTRSLSNEFACLDVMDSRLKTVMTVDLRTGSAALSARKPFPATPVHDEDPFFSIWKNQLSPDERHIVYVRDGTESGPGTYTLWLGRRSAIYHRQITDINTSDAFAWSPDSQHLAYMDMDWGSNNWKSNLITVDLRDWIFHRETIPDTLDDTWPFELHMFVWSPDSTFLATALKHTSNGTTLMIRRATEPHSKFVPLPNQTMLGGMWYMVTERQAFRSACQNDYFPI